MTSILNRFRFIGAAPPSPNTFRTLRPQLFDVEDQETGRECILKLWQKTGTDRDEDLRHVWRHEMRHVERVMATSGAQEVIVELLEILEDASYFGILLDHTGTPLEVLLEQVTRGHWLRNLGSARARILLWRNAIQLARALGLVHAQGLVHGRLEAGTIMTEGADSPDFRLASFEWSLWLQDEEVSPAHSHWRVVESTQALLYS